MNTCIRGIQKSRKTNSMAGLEKVTLTNLAMLLCLSYILSNVMYFN